MCSLLTAKPFEKQNRFHWSGSVISDSLANSEQHAANHEAMHIMQLAVDNIISAHYTSQCSCPAAVSHKTTETWYHPSPTTRA